MRLLPVPWALADLRGLSTGVEEALQGPHLLSNETYT